ncbi:hypothetical protein Tco_1030689 [Tanacetum coccineum]|uniref:RNA-directed DNA polymerase, eukaryota n=1 Tax=Tanacetum coccineum TaxID=301880 RepID=A0ABQ5G822_9ASTR
MADNTFRIEDDKVSDVLEYLFNDEPVNAPPENAREAANAHHVEVVAPIILDNAQNIQEEECVILSNSGEVEDERECYRIIKTYHLKNDDSLTLSHLFYADDAVFIGKWDRANILTIVRMLKCFFLASGLQINILKSKLMGIGVSNEEVLAAANIIGCSTFSTPFSYLGVKVGMSPSRRKAWDEIIGKVSNRLSKWKIKTLSVGGRLTLIKCIPLA